MTEYVVRNEDGSSTNVPAEDHAGLGDSAAANQTVAGSTATPTGDEAVANAQPVESANEDETTRQQNEADSKEAAAKQAAADAQFRTENPDAPIARAANPEVGGESFQ